jgi:UDP-N-acetylmuramate: L-alanyl-gamma-D-glutamyl-meso-diaminopimelate ligase
MKKAHLIDINNSFIFDLAIALKEKGYEISGSGEGLLNDRIQKLSETGIVYFPHWSSENIDKNIDFIVPAAHIQANNPEIRRAKELNLQIISIPEFVYHWTKSKTRVVIVGSKRKEGLLSMIIYVLKKQKLSFDCFLNNPVPGLECIADLSYNSRISIIEGDEWASSPIEKKHKLEFYRPHIALIPNIEWEASKEFSEKDAYLKIFRDFVSTIERDGKFIYSEQDKASNELLSIIRDDITAIPYTKHTIIKEGRKIFLDTRFGKFPFRSAQAHLLENMNGARYTCRQLGVKDVDFYTAVSEMSMQSKK